MGSESDPAHPEGYLWDGFLCCAEHGACFCWEGTKHTLGRPLGGAQQHLLFYKLCPAYKRWVFLTSEGWGVILQHGPSSVLKTLEMRVQKGDLSRALWSSVPSVWGSWQIQPHLKQSLLLVPRVVGSCNMTISGKITPCDLAARWGEHQHSPGAGGRSAAACSREMLWAAGFGMEK